MAVDSYNTGQMVMLLEDNRLMYGDINKRKFSFLGEISADELWYCNDIVGFITDEGDIARASKHTKQFVTFPVYQVCNDQLAGFVQKFLDEQKKTKEKKK